MTFLAVQAANQARDYKIEIWGRAHRMKPKFLFLILILFIVAKSTFALNAFFEDSSLCEGSFGLCEELKWDEKEKICRVVTVANCCGNKVCEGGEDYGNCTPDCTPTKLDITLINPQNEEVFYRGEKIFIKTQILAHGRSANSSDANAEGFFGFLKLENDGKHGDEKVSDSFFGNYVTVEKNQEPGIMPIKINAYFKGISQVLEFNLNVKSELFGQLNLEETYALGGIIELKGLVQKKDAGIKVPLDLNIVSAGKLIYEISFESSENGEFDIPYHTSLIDPTGKWTITLSGTDENNNSVYLQKEIEVLTEKKTSFLEIHVLNELKEKYKRGENLEIIVELLDDGKTVSGAETKLFTPLGETFVLEETAEGQYAAIYKINYKTPLENQVFRITAEKKLEDFSFEGSKDLNILIEKTEPIIKVLSPAEDLYNIGQSIDLRVKVTYSDEEPTVGAEVKALVNKTEVKLLPVAPGIYSASYAIKEEDTGNIKIFFSAKDEFENENLSQIRIDVAGSSLSYFLYKNMLLIVAIAAIVAVSASLFGGKFLSKKNIKKLEKEKKEILSLQKDLQKGYFEQNAIPENEYKKLAEEYGRMLDEIETKRRELNRK